MAPPGRLSLAEIGTISVTLGVVLTIAGALAGGWFTNRYGIFRALLWLGISQLPPRSAWAVAAANAVYSDIGRLILERGPRV